MKTVLSALALTALAGVASARPVLYSQPVDTSAGGIFSDAITGQYYDQLIGDGFALSGNSQVTGVTFWGASENFSGDVDLSNMSSFTVTLHANAAGIPGAALYSETFATAATNPVQIGVDPFAGSNLYRQEVTFTAAQNLAAGSYFVSIGATLIDGFGSAWIWESSLGGFGDNISAQLPVGGAWANFAGFGDMSFEINGVVPTPGAASLLGVAGLAGLRRRR